MQCLYLQKDPEFTTFFPPPWLLPPSKLLHLSHGGSLVSLSLPGSSCLLTLSPHHRLFSPSNQTGHFHSSQIKLFLCSNPSNGSPPHLKQRLKSLHDLPSSGQWYGYSLRLKSSPRAWLTHANQIFIPMSLSQKGLHSHPPCSFSSFFYFFHSTHHFLIQQGISYNLFVSLSL